MKKFLSFLLITVLLLSLTGCGKEKTFEISITVPAGSTADFVYADELISPLGKEITIRSGQGLGDTEVLLKPIQPRTETAYEPTYLTPGMPVTFKLEKGIWFKVGVSVQNPTEEDLTVSVVVEGADVGIP